MTGQYQKRKNDQLTIGWCKWPMRSTAAFIHFFVAFLLDLGKSSHCLTLAFNSRHLIGPNWPQSMRFQAVNRRDWWVALSSSPFNKSSLRPRYWPNNCPSIISCPFILIATRRLIKSRKITLRSAHCLPKIRLLQIDQMNNFRSENVDRNWTNRDQWPDLTRHRPSMAEISLRPWPWRHLQLGE